MKIQLNIEAESATELQNAVLQLADFCSLVSGTAKPEPLPAAEADKGEAIPTAPVQPSKPAREPVKPAVPAYTTEQVRELLEPLTEAKGSGWVKALLGEMGATNLSKMDPAQYPELLKRAGLAA